METDDRQQNPSRVVAARRRVRNLKVGVAVAATGVFATTAAAAYRAHPGASGGSTQLEPPSSFTDQLSQSDFFGQGSFGPGQDQGGSAPSASTHTS